MQATIDHGGYFTNLPREYYVSDEIFEQELRKVFAKQWLLVGHANNVRKAGDYFVKDVGPESIIITRDDSLRVRAFFNVCRHRGSRILDDNACGSAQGFVCPYHRWTYDLQGRLRRVPGAKDGELFNYADFPLKEARVHIWHGWVYIYLGLDEPPSLDETLSKMVSEEVLRTIGSAHLKLAHRETYEINANWKTLVENNMECYHCGNGGHPSLAISCDFQAWFADRAPPPEQRQHFPLRKDMQTFSMDGKRVSKKPLGTPQADQFSTGFLLTPAFCGPVFFADHVVSLEVTPISTRASRLVCEWYVHEDAVEGADYNVPDLTEVFHVTNLEDGRFAEQNYRGVLSSRFEPGPHIDNREGGVRAALQQYLDMMEAD